MKTVRVTKKMIDAALEELRCMNDEMCSHQWEVKSCDDCREKATSAIKAALRVIEQRK